MAVYNIDENLTAVLSSAMCTCFMSHLLVLVLVLVSRELVLALLVLVLVLVLLQLVLTTIRDFQPMAISKTIEDSYIQRGLQERRQHRPTNCNNQCPEQYGILWMKWSKNWVNYMWINAFVVIRPDNGVGPAVTVDVKCATSRNTLLSVDMVPAVRLLEWPPPAKNWTSCWLSSEIVSGIKRPEHHHKSVKPSVVPKIHPTGTRIS